jgi:hypothetical protein
MIHHDIRMYQLLMSQARKSCKANLLTSSSSLGNETMPTGWCLGRSGFDKGSRYLELSGLPAAAAAASSSCSSSRSTLSCTNEQDILSIRQSHNDTPLILEDLHPAVVIACTATSAVDGCAVLVSIQFYRGPEFIAIGKCACRQLT